MDAPSGYHSAVLAPTFRHVPGGINEFTVKLTFVSGNTILIGFAKDYVDLGLSDKSNTCFYRSNGSSIYENGSTRSGHPSKAYKGGDTIVTTFNMATGEITWLKEKTNESVSYTYPKLISN